MEIKKETRNLGIKGFRNIGFKNESETEERLILNYSLNKDYLGDLVILIGPNNAGKSNVLDAISAWSANNFDDKRNVSAYFMMPKMRQPLVELFTLVDDKRTLIKPKITSNNELSSSNPINVFNYLINSFAPDLLENSYLDPDYTVTISRNGEALKYNDYISAIEYARDTWPRYHALSKFYIDFSDKNFRNLVYGILIDLVRLENSVDETAAATISHLKQNKIWGAFLDEYEYNVKTNKLTSIADIVAKVKLSKENKTLEKSSENNSNDDLFKYIPHVIRYEEHHINNKDLICNANEIEKSNFFNAILKMMGSDISELKTTYDQLHEINNRSILVSESNRLTRKLAKITKYFNELYCLDKDKYEFKIQLNPDDISFSIFKLNQSDPDDPVSLFLDYQSTGFRWFFDLFFNVFATNTLQAGDIIIMDEPATNLHVYGQIELRKFLKQFAIEHGITFVIATHSPFIVDLDYLDEIRIITTHDQNIASIENNFSVINAKDDPDSLAAIRKSLTVTNNVIINEDQIVVFVEGITDYNYLTAMKNWFNDDKYNKLTFLPIQGLGTTHEDKKNRLNKLQNIHHLNSVLLTDGDRAGQEFSELNNGTTHPFRLISLDKLGFNEIEDLFDLEDQTKFGIIKEKHANDADKWNKNTITSVYFKKVLYKDALNKQANKNNADEACIITSKTHANFKKVFDEILHLVEKPN